MSSKLPKQPRDKDSGLPKKYVAGLSKEDKKKQVKSIKEGKDRPKLKSAPPSKRSSHVEKFEKKYGYKITNDSRISKEIISKTGIDQILSKGRGAYYSQGSRPNTTPTQWARARLASVIMGGKARQVDKAIWEKYKK
tara:strand:+ start:256 stop:666 length:411 start_codon:yes stop_codon:yes gene_type:complete